MINPFYQLEKSFPHGDAYKQAWACGLSFNDVCKLMQTHPITHDEALFWVLMEWMDEYHQWDNNRDYNNVYSICTGEVVMND